MTFLWTEKYNILYIVKTNFCKKNNGILENAIKLYLLLLKVIYKNLRYWKFSNRTLINFILNAFLYFYHWTVYIKNTLCYATSLNFNTIITELTKENAIKDISMP